MNKDLFYLDIKKNYLLMICLIIGFILLGNVSLIEFGDYVGWRKTQTLVAYDCFIAAQNITQELKCFLSPPVGIYSESGDSLRFSRLEIPWMQFLHSVISLEYYTNLFNLLMFYVLILIFTHAFWVSNFNTVQSVAILSLLFLGLLKSPNYIFLVKGYSPDILSTSLILFTIFLYAAYNRKYLYVSYLLLAVVVSVRPQLSILIGLYVFFMQHEKFGIGLSLKELLKLDKIFKSFIYFFLIITPFLLIYSYSHLFFSDVSPYPHTLIGGISSLSELKYVLFDRLSSNGFVLIFIVLLLLFYSVKHVFWQVLFIIFAYFITFYLFYNGFKANSYYGVLSIPFLLTLIYILIFSFKDVSKVKEHILLPSIFLVGFFGLMFNPKHGTNQYLLMYGEGSCSVENLKKASKFITDNHINSSSYLNPQISYFMKSGVNYRLDTLSTPNDVQSFFKLHNPSSIATCGHYSQFIVNNEYLFNWLNINYDSYYFDDVLIMKVKE